MPKSGTTTCFTAIKPAWTMPAIRRGSTPPPATVQSVSIASPSAVYCSRHRFSSPWLEPPTGHRAEMGTTILLSTIAALGVLVACIAMALPGGDAAANPRAGAEGGAEGRWEQSSVRDRIYQPVVARADLSYRRRP